MCGRYKLDLDWTDIVRLYRLDPGDPLDFVPRYNVAPTQRMPVILADGGRRVARWMHWGFLAPWSARKEAGRTINARAETVATSRMYRAAFARRRALVPATGFYEWRRLPDRKVPTLIRPADGGPMALAGIWQAWRDPESGAWMDTYAILTCAPNAKVAAVHDRMPVVLPAERWDRWLDPETDPALAEQALVAPPEDALELVEVSERVNSVRNDDPEVGRPVGG